MQFPYARFKKLLFDIINYVTEIKAEIKRIMSQKMIKNLFSDDPELAKEYSKRSSISSTKIHTNNLTFIQLYNERNK